MARPAAKRPRRRRPTTAALLRLSRDYRLWALLPHVDRILLQVDNDDKNGTGEIVGDATRPKFPKGVCRKCGCSEYDACYTRIGPCGWVDATKTLCTACEGKQ